MGASDYEDIIPDKWFIGYSTNTISAWTGYDNPYEQGGDVDTTEQKLFKTYLLLLNEIWLNLLAGDDGTTRQCWKSNNKSKWI